MKETRFSTPVNIDTFVKMEFFKLLKAKISITISNSINWLLGLE